MSLSLSDSTSSKEYIYCGDTIYIPKSNWITKAEYQAKSQQNPDFDFCSYSYTDSEGIEHLCGRFAVDVCRMDVGVAKHKYRCEECPVYVEPKCTVWVNSDTFIQQILTNPTYSPPIGSNKNKFAF